MLKRFLAGVLLLASCSSGTNAADLPPAIDASDMRHLRLGLQALKMSEGDLSFSKTNADSERVLQKARLFLDRPLTLPAYSHHLTTNLQATTSLAAISRLAREQVEVAPAAVSGTAEAIPVDSNFLAQLPAPMARSIESIAKAAGIARELLTQAFPADKDSPFASFLIDKFGLDRETSDFASWEKMGFNLSKARELARRGAALELQEDETVRGLLEGADQLDDSKLFAAFETLAASIDVAIRELKSTNYVQEFQLETETPLGKIICGGIGRNLYTNEAFLILDLGGDDTYLNNAGSANGLLGRPISLALDLGGNDEFISRQHFSQGVGIFGVGILAALGNRSTFSGGSVSQGVGVFGCGLLLAGNGSQTFQADTFCQGAAMFGAGILWQLGGDTTYRAYEQAQGFGGTGAIGLLLDAAGNDVYTAGGKNPCPWVPGQYFSLAQGFGYGLRPFAGGGVGVLADLKGGDRYVADVYGQGSSYWYATGLLLDVEGNDFYQAFHYCQGSGIHLSSGALIDWAGDELYSAGILAQGNAHDYAVGFLIDRAGNDDYIGKYFAQGTAINNSFALLLDHEGDDFYAGRDTMQSQAAGQNGARREYGSIALFLDLAGADTYSQGQSNNAIRLKPLYGALLDVESTNRPVGLDPIVWTPPPETKGPRAARTSYRQIDPHQPIESLLRRSMRDGDTEAHQKDAEAASAELTRLGNEALAYLFTRMDSPDVLVRVKAEALMDPLGTNCVPTLISAIETAPNEEAARVCAFLLARFGDKRLDQTSSFDLPVALPDWTPLPNSDRVARVLLPLLSREKLQATVLYTLGHWRIREAIPAALELLNSPRESIRARAAQALGRVGTADVIPQLMQALDDEMWTVRYAAENSLQTFGDASVRAIQAALPSAPTRAKLHMIEVLARLGDRTVSAKAKPILEELDPILGETLQRALEEDLKQ